jgi:hypothetical protein
MERIPRGGGGRGPISANATRVAAAREAAASAGRKAAVEAASRARGPQRPIQDEGSIIMKLMRSYQNAPDLSVRRRRLPSKPTKTYAFCPWLTHYHVVVFFIFDCRTSCCRGWMSQTSSTCDSCQLTSLRGWTRSWLHHTVLARPKRSSS